MPGKSLRLRFCAAAVWALLWARDPTWAGVPPDATQRMDAAFTAIDALAAQARLAGTLPRLTDPADAAVLEKVWQAQAILGAPPYRSADVGPLLDVLDKQKRIYRAYLLFTADPAAPADIPHNTYVFQDEVTRATAFLMLATAAATQALGDFALHLKPGEFTDVRRSGVSQLRAGTVEFLSGWAEMVQSPALRPENRRRLVESLTEAGAALAQDTPPRYRDAIIKVLIPVVTSLQDHERAMVQQVVSAMASRRCEGFCRIE